jgi:hypothetical protein
VPASDSDNSDTLPAAAYQALTAQQGLPGSQPLLACHGLLGSTAMISDALPIVSQPLLQPLGPPSPTTDPISAPVQQLRTGGSDQDDAQAGDGKVRKGQGYRRLWQMVTKVQRGQRLADGTFEWRDCTVEDLLKIVQQLPANASTVSAVAPGLVYLDSRAAAAFFKALAKTGHGARAVELFDYLRCAPAGCDMPHVSCATNAAGSCSNAHPQLAAVLQQRRLSATCWRRRCKVARGSGGTSAQQQQAAAGTWFSACSSGLSCFALAPLALLVVSPLPPALCRVTSPTRLVPKPLPLLNPYPPLYTSPLPTLLLPTGRWRRATSCAACVMCSPTPP